MYWHVYSFCKHSSIILFLILCSLSAKLRKVIYVWNHWIGRVNNNAWSVNHQVLHASQCRAFTSLGICSCVHVWLNGGVTQQMDKCPFLIYRPREQEWQSLWLCQRCWTWGSSQQRGSCSRHLSRSMSASITAGMTPLSLFPTSKIHLCVFCLQSLDRDFGTDGLLQKIEHKK